MKRNGGTRAGLFHEYFREVHANRNRGDINDEIGDIDTGEKQTEATNSVNANDRDAISKLCRNPLLILHRVDKNGRMEMEGNMDVNRQSFGHVSVLSFLINHNSLQFVGLFAHFVSF